MRLSGKLVLAALIAAAASIGTGAQSLGAGGGFTLDHRVSNSNGTATIPAHFSHRGRVHIADNQEITPCGGPPQIQSKTLKVKPGDRDLLVKANKEGLANLPEKVKVAFQFTPPGGSETTKRVTVSLMTSGGAMASAPSPAFPRCGAEPPPPSTTLAAGENTVILGTPTARPNGTASVPVTVSGPGRLIFGDAIHLRPCGAAPRIRDLDTTVQEAGTVVAPIKPLPRIKDDLKRGRRVRIPLTAQFWPGGVPSFQVEAFGSVVLHSKSSGKTVAASESAEYRC